MNELIEQLEKQKELLARIDIFLSSLEINKMKKTPPVSVSVEEVERKTELIEIQKSIRQFLEKHHFGKKRHNG